MHCQDTNHIQPLTTYSAALLACLQQPEECQATFLFVLVFDCVCFTAIAYLGTIGKPAIIAQQISGNRWRPVGCTNVLDPR